MIDAILDALLDTLKIFGIIFVFYFIVSFIEDFITKVLNKKSSPLIGSAFGLIPSCGISVIASDLYIRDYLSMGTLLAIFISCNDEALPIILTKEKGYLSLIMVLIIKFIVAFFIGFLIDFIFKKQKINSKKITETECEHHNFVHDHLLHPLKHALEIIIYVLIVNVIFSILIYLIGEDNIKQFLMNREYITPLFCSIIGLIPNCASSILISTLFVNGSLPFSSMMAGLICNAGVGLLFLYRQKSKAKDALLITLLLLATSIAVSYILLFVEINL